MGLPNVTLTWRSIKVLRAIVSTMSAIGLIMVLAGIVWAIKLKRDIGDYLNLVVPGDGHLWPTVIVVAAVPCAPVYLLGLKSYICLHLATPRNRIQLDEHDKTGDEDSEHSEDFQDSNDNVNEKNNGLEANRILFIHAILCLISGCLVAAINVACFLKSTTFQQKIRNDGSFDGFIEAMDNYASDDRIRSCVDAIQMEFQCCGSYDYRDWFRVNWVKQSVEYFDYVDNEHQQEEQSMEKDQGQIIIIKDVPYSCCTNKIVEPCGQREILRASQVCNFELNKDETVWNLGCRSIVLTHARIIGLFLIFLLILLSLYQFLIGILSRLLQTAHSNEFYIGPKKLYYRGWIFNRISNPCSKCSNLSQESDEDTPETQSLVQETLESPNVPTEKWNNRSSKRKRQQEHKFILTPRGSVQLLQINRLRKIQSSPLLSMNEPIDVNPIKSKIKMYRYKPLVMTEHDRDLQQQNDNKMDYQMFVEKSDTSVKANLKSREKKNLSNIIIAPVPPPFPPQSEEYEEKRHLLLNKVNKNQELSITKLRSTYFRYPNNDNNRNKIEKEFVSKPSKQDRRKLLDKFEQILKTEETNRRESGGADIPRPWEQLVQRSIDSPEKEDHEDRMIQSPRGSEQNHVLSRFHATDAYDRFRGTLQDTLSRRENPYIQNKTIVKRPIRPRMCPCCTKRNRNINRSSGCKFQQNPSYSYPIDPEDFRIVQRTNLLPDIPCPPTPPPAPPPSAPPILSPLRVCESPCYPRPTLIRQQQREQRRQQRQCRSWNFRRNFNDKHQQQQQPPWTLATSFSRPITNFNPRSNNNCVHCQTRQFLNTGKEYSTFKQNYRR